MGEQEKFLSLYLHIPFCRRKCLYCDFLSAPAGEKEMERYVELLCEEIRREGGNYSNYHIKTIYLGGGTPSLLFGVWIERILAYIRQYFQVDENCEISMEANPGTVTPEKLAAWRRAGINRLSLGLQSAKDNELRALGRIHDSKTFFQTYKMVIESGFNNVNVDLMSGIPEQSLASCRKTLEKVTGLAPRPTHISAYSLIVEEGTPFYENTPPLPDEDAEREMYQMVREFLEACGYRRYEISNYALPGYECRHNLVYWRRGNYLGFGVGAASLIENVRFRNPREIGKYREMVRGLSDKEQGQLREEYQVLTAEEQMEEFMFLGLRTVKGVSCGEFQQLFGKSIAQVYPGIVEDFCRKGLLTRRREPGTGEERISLTAYGMDVSNLVMAEFLLTA
ncbi:MAG: radical SAM family heme chaperone HemW [Clostridium sp.]|nr:radical SAM family heme chaperone HemW [Clostridium sp.]